VVHRVAPHARLCQHQRAWLSPQAGNDAVAGRVFRITAEELEAADRYEVSDYKRVQVVLKSGIAAWAYVKA
jgi:gamma-glutamylcyclotransferase (GGCT)/AIG2-like uncharacterized protein YtfP